MASTRFFCAAATAAVGAALSGCGGDGGSPATNVLPAGMTHHGVTEHPATAPGTGATAATQDLFTAGLSRSGLGSATTPVYADPLNPTAAVLRRNAIWATTAPSSTRARTAATAHCTDLTSTTPATTRSAKG
jgi:hypothetical protein